MLISKWVLYSHVGQVLPNSAGVTKMVAMVLCRQEAASRTRAK